MNLNLIRRNEKLSYESEIKQISQKLKLHHTLVELLFSRGLNSEQSIRQYLTPNSENLYDPFELKGMTEAVERLKKAIENEEKIVVYGDYDADGICAAAILSLFLADCGLEVYPHIPNRVGDGYGLSVESIERIIDSCNPDLILTCDCGISGQVEVAHAMDLGVDVIVTDHHEVSDTIPECIVINPKQNDCNYPYKYLCGAGVALKLVQAIGGVEKALQYTDLAAIATIADLVPLLDENRLIVQLGLTQMGKKKNLGLKLLLENQGLTYPPSSGDIAYKIAPRINAAGRMGDAYRAFELLTLTDEVRVKEILEQINEDNNKRKELCDVLYDEAVKDLAFEDLINTRAIILSNPTWEKGITGILAARLAGDFRRPAFVMVNSGEQYKGTSRSVAGINIYELLSSVSDLLIEFGGHSQAAGFSIKEENIAAFKQRVKQYLNTFPQNLFELNLEFDIELPVDELNLELAKALELMEPCGNSNTRPTFKTDISRVSISPCKNNYNHTNIIIPNGLQVLAFNFYSQNQFLMGDFAKELVVELQLNTYGNKESAKGILKGVCPSELYINDEVAKANFFKTLAFLPSELTVEKYDNDSLESVIGTNIFGTLIIAGCLQSYKKFSQKFGHLPFLNEFLYSTSKNNYSRIIVSPEMDENLLLANYEKIIFLDSPPANAILPYIAKKSNAKVYVPSQNNEGTFYTDISADRAVFGKYFAAIKACQGKSSSNVLSFFKYLGSAGEYSLSQYIFTVMVLSELKLISTTKGSFTIKINKDVKKELTESKIFNYVAAFIK